MEQTFKSPRKIEEEIRDYQCERFEAYMRMADEGKLSRELALTALREEMDHVSTLESTNPLSQ